MTLAAAELALGKLPLRAGEVAVLLEGLVAAVADPAGRDDPTAALVDL